MTALIFSEAQEMFRKEMRNYARRELAPVARERAKSERVAPEVLRKLGKDQILGIIVPEKYGGQGSDWVSLGIAMEELSRVSLFEAFVPLLPALSWVVLRNASEELRQQWLPGLARGEKMVCWGLTEPGAGSDAAAIQTRAVSNGRGYVLNGEKTSITMGMVADAAMLFAKTDPEAGAKGVSCFWMPLDLPGVSRSPLVHTGWKPMCAASIFMNDVPVSPGMLIGERGQGFKLTMGMADCARPTLGILTLGMAQASLEEAITYVQQRNAFGRPLAKFEALSFRIADRATAIEAARLLCYNTLAMEDAGLKHTKESAMCKLLCPQVALPAVHDSLVIHGHIGYSEEFPLEQRLRDTMGVEFADGTPDIMRLVIARELMGRVAVPY